MRINTGKTSRTPNVFTWNSGAAVALPFLDSMRPALAATKRAPLRIAFTYVPNGVIMKDWKPASTGFGLRVYPYPQAAGAFPQGTCSSCRA